MGNVTDRPEARFRATQLCIAETIKDIDSTLAGYPELTTFQMLTAGLSSFCDHQFRAYRTLQVMGATPGSFSIPDGYTHEYAQSLIQSRVSDDLTVIAQAAKQRTQPFMRATLLLADKLIDELIAPALDKSTGIFNSRMKLNADLKPVALAYFQKSPVIRVIPYANVALIGIPYSCINPLIDGGGVSTDLLAIAHELGHYVYWNGNSKLTIKDKEWQGSIFQLVKLLLDQEDFQPYARRWAEECFADVYGCRVAGAYLALDNQRYQLERYASEEFRTDDRDHPVPLLRPEIHLTTLAGMSGHERTAELLSELWDKDKKVVLQGKRRVRFSSGAEAQSDLTPLEYLQGELKRLVLRFNDILAAVEINPRFDVTSVLGTQADKPLAEQLQESWEQLLSAVDLNPAPKPPPASSASKSSGEDEWKKLVFDQLVPEDQRFHPKPLVGETEPERQWVIGLSVGGWITGPQDNAPKPG